MLPIWIFFLNDKGVNCQGLGELGVSMATNYGAYNEKEEKHFHFGERSKEEEGFCESPFYRLHVGYTLSIANSILESINLVVLFEFKIFVRHKLHYFFYFIYLAVPIKILKYRQIS